MADLVKSRERHRRHQEAEGQAGRTAEDVLWRRSKLGLHVSRETAGRVATHLGDDSHALYGALSRADVATRPS